MTLFVSSVLVESNKVAIRLPGQETFFSARKTKKLAGLAFNWWKGLDLGYILIS